MRRFISLLSAAAVLATVAAVPITASAEDVFTYDGSDVSGWTAGDSHLLITKETDDNGDFVKITTDGSSNYSTSYALPEAAQLEDNYVIEYDIMVHQSNGMGRFGRYAQAAFISADAEKDTRDFTAYKDLLGSGGAQDSGGNGYVTGVASSVTSIYGIKSAIINYTSDDELAPSDDDTGIVSDVWYRVQTAVSGTTATVTVIDGNGEKIADAEEYANSASKLDKIFVTVGRGDAAVTGGGIVALDNVRIYEGEAEELTTDGLRRALENYTVTFVADDATVAEKSVIEGNTLSDIPAVPEKEGYIGTWVLEDGTAFTSSTAVTGDMTVVAEYAAAVEASAKAATVVVDDELRISDGTNGAVFRFETKDLIPEGQEIKKALLIVKVAPRSYKASDNRFENANIYTYRVSSSWNGTTNTITNDDWNKLSKNDPIDKQWSDKYPTADSTVAAPWQTLNAIDVTSAVGSDGVAIFAFKTESAREHAIDATLTITTQEAGSEPEPSEPAATATAEPASAVEGSNLELLPSGSTWSTTFAAAEGESAVVINHSAAKAAAEGSVSVYNADTNYRGKSIYALYDVLVNAGDKLTVEAYNKTDLGTTFTLTGNADGTATAAAKVNKGDSVAVGTVVCGTWYRVLIEIPQNNNNGATNTGNAAYTIYRIDPEAPANVTEVAAARAELTPRNLASKAATELKVSVTGTPYIDNGVAFVNSQGLGLIEEAVTPAPTAAPEPESTVEGSNIDLVAKDGRAVADAFAAVNGASAVILNHSDAKAAAAGTINAYHEKARGNSTYVAYDVLVNAGDKLTLAAKNGSSVGPAFIITGNENGTATASYVNNSNNRGGTLSGNLVCGTWYRVVIEMPISSNGKCGKAVYTVYRIDPENPAQTLEAAAKATGIAPRNLSDRALSTFDVTVDGTPYIDNGVVYINPNSADTTDVWTKYTFTKDENGVLTGVTLTVVSDPAAAYAALADNEYLWNQYQTPYTPAEADENSPS